LQRKLIEGAAIVGTLQQVEQREPRERRYLGILIVDDALL
jgi:hypothetical protein